MDFVCIFRETQILFLLINAITTKILRYFFFKEKARFLFICFDRQFAYRSMTKAEDALEV